MFKNYVTTFIRNLMKDKMYSFLNIGGLTVGIAATVLILLYVRNELSYDSFNEKADRIHIISFRGNFGGSPINASFTSAPMASTLENDYPEVEGATRFFADIGSGSKLVEYGDQKFYESGWKWADSGVFNIFTYPLIIGDPTKALAQPNSVVISEEMREKYFGSEDPLGKIVKFNRTTNYAVTGVMKNIPLTTHLHFDFLASFSTLPNSNNKTWLGAETYTYILLREGVDPNDLQSKLPQLIEKYVAPQVEQAIGQSYKNLVQAGFRAEYYLQPLTDLYLKREAVHEIATASSDINYIYIFLAVALGIISIASINYMNLSTARAKTRAREVGMRKALGSRRKQLVTQFLVESTVSSLIATVLAFGAIEIFLPAFNSFTQKQLSLAANIVQNIDVVLGMILMSVLVGVIAGFYPALLLSSFKPTIVLKGTPISGSKHGWLRNGLVVFQFVVSIGLLVGTAVVYKQLDYMRNMKLGFDKEQVVTVQLESQDAIGRFESFRNELLTNSHILNAASADGIPGRFFLVAGFRPEDAANNAPFSFVYNRVSFDFIDALGLEMAGGREFSRDFQSDTVDAWVINEKAARSLGWDNNSAIGKKLTIQSSRVNSNKSKKVVGVVRDFHFESLHEEIKPLVLSIGSRSNRYAIVKFDNSDIPRILSFIESKWSSFEPGYPFHYNFLDEDFGRLFQQESRLGELFTYFTGLAIFIACLGLFSLASYVTQQRTKEICVRKILGASSSEIAMKFIRQFTILVGIAILIAAPVAYYAMNRWLQDFAFRTSIDATEFLLAGLISLVIAWLTVGYQSAKAALANPVDGLRYE